MSRISSVICLFVLLAVPARASLTIQSSNDGGALSGPGITYANFDGLPLGSVGGTSPALGGLTVSFIGNAEVVNSGLSPHPTYAMPFLSGDNGKGFGSPDQTNGPDLTHYITAGKNLTHSLDGANATLEFSATCDYLGILWGSVDTYNRLSLFLGGSLVAQITGNDVTSNPDGNQGLGGTYYVNITGVSFDKAVMTSSEYAFEFDNVAYGTVNGVAYSTAVPEASTLAVWLVLSTIGIGVACRKHSHRA